MLCNSARASSRKTPQTTLNNNINDKVLVLLQNTTVSRRPVLPYSDVVVLRWRRSLVQGVLRSSASRDQGFSPHRVFWGEDRGSVLAVRAAGKRAPSYLPYPTYLTLQEHMRQRSTELLCTDHHKPSIPNQRDIHRIILLSLWPRCHPLIASIDGVMPWRTSYGKCPALRLEYEYEYHYSYPGRLSHFLSTSSVLLRAYLSVPNTTRSDPRTSSTMAALRFLFIFMVRHERDLHYACDKRIANSAIFTTSPFASSLSYSEA